MAPKNKSVKSAPPPPPPIQVSEARLSCIFFFPALALLQSRNPPKIPAGFLLDDVGFTSQYEKLSDPSLPAEPLQPGRAEYGWGFWNRFGTGGDPGKLRRALIPVVSDLAPIVNSLSLADGAVSATAFLYPWGVSILIDITLRGPLALEAAVDRLIEIRKNPSIAWKMGSDSGKARPQTLASEIYKRLAGQLYGTPPGEVPGEPFSIVTITDGSGISPTAAITPDGPLHRALEGLISWNPIWQDIPAPAGSLDPPGSPGSCRIDTRNAPLGHVLYGRGRARVIWFPRSFTTALKGASTLSCFHQNLSAGTAHTDALVVLACDGAAEIEAHGSLDNFSVTYRNCAQLGAGLLGRLHGKKDAPVNKPPNYRSGSIRAHILNNQKQVNSLRTFYPAMGPLDATTALPSPQPANPPHPAKPG
jgi:hypothetical protein